MVKRALRKIKLYFGRRADYKPRSLTKIYIIALSSIAVTTVLFQVIRFTEQMEIKSTISSIREVDKHSLRVNILYDNIVENQINTQRLKKNNIHRRLLKMSDSHKLLLSKLREFKCYVKECRVFLNPDYFSSKADSFIKSSLSESASLEQILTEVEEYKKFLILVNQFYENKIQNLSENLIYLDVIFLLLIIFILLIQAFYGFKPAVEKLDEALSARSDFISRISHEIRNPMNAIMGMTDILISTKLSSEQNQYAKNIQRASHVLMDMLNNLVDFSSTKNKKIVLKKDYFDIRAFVDQILDFISIQAHEKNLEVYVDFDTQIPDKIFADKIQLEQVLINLLNNSLKFTDSGYISLQVNLTEINEHYACVKFTVEDSGIGIESTKIKEIFKSFVQEDSSIKRRFGGAGLGLFICKQIVALYDSEIFVESEKNKGSKFYFTIETKFEGDKSNDFFANEKFIFYLSGNTDNTLINKYLSNIGTNFKILDSSDDLQPLISDLDSNFLLIVDDSIGIVSMTTIDNSIIRENSIALMRSNFPKENMDILQKNGYKNFLIKPFRAWHIERNINHLTGDSGKDTASTSTQETSTKHDAQLLIVDDSNDNLFLMREILSTVTDKIDFAKNGAEACEKAKNKKYDMIFMDIQMPVMDGYSAIRKIRSTNKATPIYAVTAHHGVIEENKCIDAGFNGRILKPIARKELLSLVDQTFNTNESNNLKRSSGIEDQLIQKLLPSYFEAREEDIILLDKAVQEKDSENLKRIGHKIQGSAMSYGFPKVGELAKDLELSASDLDFKRCENLVHKIKSLLSESKTKFNSKS